MFTELMHLYIYIYIYIYIHTHIYIYNVALFCRTKDSLAGENYFSVINILMQLRKVLISHVYLFIEGYRVILHPL